MADDTQKYLDLMGPTLDNMIKNTVHCELCGGPIVRREPHHLYVKELETRTHQACAEAKIAREREKMRQRQQGAK